MIYDGPRLSFCGEEARTIETSQHIPIGLFDFCYKVDILGISEEIKLVIGMSLDDKCMGFRSDGTLDSWGSGGGVYDKLDAFGEGDSIVLRLHRIIAGHQTHQYITFHKNDKRLGSRISEGTFIRPGIGFVPTKNINQLVKVESVVGSQCLIQGKSGFRHI